MNPATHWARVFLDELSRAGVKHVCIAPGSRSTPLVLSAGGDERFRCTVHLDERCAGFFALGIGKATGVPAAVITTSGTAAANLYPAIVEASQAETPLLLITADRPHRQRGTDANQTIDQIGMFGGYVRAFLDLPNPRLDEADLLRVRAMGCQAVAAAKGLPAGPVHVNAPFAKPLEPTPDDGAVLVRAAPGLRMAMEGRPRGAPLTRVPTQRPLPATEEIDELAGQLRRILDGIVVAGPLPDPVRAGSAIIRLAAAAGYPLLADPLSGARFGEAHGASILGSYDLFLRVPEVRKVLRPGIVLRVGRAPTSAVLCDWLAEMTDVPQVVIDPGPRWKDHRSSAGVYLRADPAGVADAMAGRVARPPSGGWRDRWSRFEDAARTAAAQGHDEGLFEGTVLADVVGGLQARHPLVVAGSMPVRDLDSFGVPRAAPLRVFGNRGASGIDGMVSTALGVAAGSGQPAVAVLGDIAFYHDMNGLLAVREQGVDAVFVVIHNDGGGIFQMLPIRAYEPAFSRYFVTPHGLDFKHAAQLYGLRFHQPGDRVAVRHALRAALAMGGSHIIEVRSDRIENQRRHEAVYEAVAAAVRQRIEEQEGTP